MKLPSELGSYYCSHTYNHQPTCHYTTSHYPSGTMEYCNNLLSSVSSSLKVSGLPRNTVFQNYMINTELYLTFSKYVDKLLLEKSLASRQIRKHPNGQPYQSASISINSQPNAPISNHTNQNWFLSYILKYFEILCFEKFLKVLACKKKNLKKGTCFLFIYFEKKIKKFLCAHFLLFYILKRPKKSFHVYFLFFKNASLFINSNVF